MKKIILIPLMLLAFGCNKSGKKLLGPDEAYCVYKHTSNGTKVFVSCEKTQTDAQNKCIEVRNAGGQDVESVKKSTCSDC